MFLENAYLILIYKSFELPSGRLPDGTIDKAKQRSTNILKDDSRLNIQLLLTIKT
jgi:hypothetical protein